MKKDTHTSRQKTRLHLLSQIGDAVRVSQQSSDLLGAQLGAFLGINHTDGRCIDILSRVGRMSAGQLATESGLTTGAVTAIIDRLEAAGYARRQRDALDRRKVWVECTPHMSVLLESIFGAYDLIGPMMVRNLSDTQLEGILAFLSMNTAVNQELAAGLKEHTLPGAKPAEQVEQTKQFRRAIDALAPRLEAEINNILPPGDAV